MGEKFLEEKAKRFKHKRDLEHERQLCSPNLLSSIQDRKHRLFRFSSPAEELNVRDRVLFVSEDNRELVTVFRGNSRIGEVDAGGSAELRSIFAQHPALSNSVPAQVRCGPDIGGHHEATIVLP
jgi:hypothetical protein